MTTKRRLLIPRWIIWSASGIAAAVITAGGILHFQEPALTKYLEGPSFRAELDKQTSKGLHFKGKYEPLKRTGFATAETAGFEADDGEKAFQSLKAEGISGKFNPWGVFLRRWQIDWIHIDSAVARIQVYEPKPQNKPSKPWYAIFMPDRVYLKEVRCEKADITWKMKDEDSGFFRSKVLVTPYGRDFEYRITGGNFVLPSLPKLPLELAHARITKETLSLYDLSLKPKGGGSIRVEGEAGLKEDKSMQVKMQVDGVLIGPWIPTSWGDQVKGRASGHITGRGPDQKIETTEGKGELNLSGAQLLSIPFLNYAASATQNETLKNIELDECVATFQWKKGILDVQEVRIEAKGQFKIKGSIKISKSSLSGTLDFGVAEKNLSWLPKAKEDIFTKEEGKYLWTKVKLSGSLQDPQNDLTPRLAQALKRSPAESTGLFFRSIGEWFKQTLGSD